MTPNFALSLSVDGISLLHRVPDGWQHAGDVSLEVADLNAEMATLKDTALALEPGGVQCKVIVPNDQIRYLNIETARTSLDDIHTAISEATPMALDEMVIDFDRSGGRTYIAAVAKQTLLEAETFAQDHGFSPISFTAIAEPYTFGSEVFFGPTSYARETLGIGAEVSRDDKPAVAMATVTPTEQPTPDNIAPTPTEMLSDDDIPVFSSRNRVKSDAVAPPVPIAADPVPDDSPIARFNRSGRSATPAIDLATAEPDAPAIPTPQIAESAEPLIATPSIARAKTRPISKGSDSSGLLAQFRAQPKPSPVPTTKAELALAKGFANGDAAGKPRYLGLALTGGLVAAIVITGMWASRQVDGGITDLLNNDPGLRDDASFANDAPVIVAAQPEPATTPEPEIETALAPAATPETTADEPPTPIVTAIPRRVLSPADAARIYAATGVWQRAPRLPGMPDETDQGTLDGVYTFATLPTVAPIAALGRPDIDDSAPDLGILAPQNPAPANRPLPRDEDGFVRASRNGTILPTGVWIYGRAPSSRPPLRPTDEPVGLDDASVPNVQEDIVTGLQFLVATPELSTLSAASPFTTPTLSQPLAITPPSIDAPQGLALANALIAPPPPAAPLEEAPAISDSLAAPPTLPDQETPEAPQTNDVASPDQIPDQQSPAQTRPALADGPITPSEEFFLADETFVEVITGRPPVVPPLRPGTPEIAPEVAEVPETETLLNGETPAVETLADETESLETAPALFQDPSLAGIRPLTRPTGLVPQGAALFEAIPTLAGFRPSLRPADLAPEITADVAPVEDDVDTTLSTATDISAIVASIAAAAPPSQIINPTRRAIVASPRPDSRPNNFSRVVSAAQTLASRQETREAAASTSAAAVQPAAAPPTTAQTASPTGGQTTVTVARAATLDNAIALRDMNLIGVYGKPGSRRALIRLSNGRFVKVEVGSSIDGGRVTAIDDSALNFVKRGQTFALQLPAS